MVYSAPPAGPEDAAAAEESEVADGDDELELEELGVDLRTTPPL